LAILFLAQILSAIMGLYTEETYRQYGPHWKENLFYSHLLALPLFLPFLPAMERQFIKLASSPPLGLPLLKRDVMARLPVDVMSTVDKLHVPSQLAYMVINVLTQYACIRGVNLLAAAASALTVTIVLNVRKLVSLLLSIWLFGNRLSPGTLIGACIVFGSGALYGLKIDGNKASAAARAQRAASVSHARRESESNGKIG
jgi:UDP-xylose/UDP-N-acetylglucosamine transporter B4